MNEENKVVEAVEEKTEEVNAMEEAMHDENAPLITVKQLLEAGAQFGHNKRKWDPSMGEYVYGERGGLYIIDLTKTVERLETAYAVLKQISENGGHTLFVGVKPQCKEFVEELAKRTGSFYITNRWLGGTLTNFKTIQTRIRRLKELKGMEEDGSFELLTKKEVALLRKEKDKLAKNLSGIEEMRKVPDAVVVVDPIVEHNAVAEAHKCKIPVFGIVDTNNNPKVLDYAIPANNEATSSIKLIFTLLADAIAVSKGLPVEVAHSKVDGEATMVDAVRAVDNVIREKKAAREAKARQFREQAEKRENFRKARFEKKAEAAKAEATQEKPAEKKDDTEAK